MTDQAPGSLEAMPNEPEYNAEQFSFIRDKWIAEQMKERVVEYTDEKLLRIFLGTWNVNAKTPSDEKEPLGKWLLHSDSPPADIYVVGFQEIVDLNAVNVVLADHQALKPWERKMQEVLRGQYELVHSDHMVGLATSVFVRRELMPHVGDVQSAHVACGILGVGRNKGGIGVRLQIFDSTLCVVNTHLAAHKNNVEGRNSDYHTICKKMQFPVTENKFTDNLTIFDQDHLFWIGDLNYRLNFKNLDLVYERIDAQDWPYLLGKDQLLTEKKARNAFSMWKEGPLTWAPTYKYKPGTPNYDKHNPNKKRFPAWCDRIQWVGEDIKQEWYRRCELHCSDHKPVCAYFAMKMRKIDKRRRETVKNSLVRQLDDWENKHIPKVSLSRNTVHFSNITFDSNVTEHLRIKNTGKSMVTYRFVPKLQEQSFCRSWLSVVQATGVIPPGQFVDLVLTVHVNRETAQALNTEEEKLEDILILRLEKGRDYFVTVSGDYQKSCFGSTVDYLVKTHQPVRYSSPANATTGKVLSIPKELWRMVDYIYRNGMDTARLFFTEPQDARQIDLIRECLDTGQEFQRFEIHAMAAALLQFLKSLAEPVFPPSLVETVNENLPLTALCMQALVKLSAANYNTFVYITAFLRELLKHSNSNALQADELVLIFAGCLMHTDLMSGRHAQVEQTKEWVILRHFLLSDEFE